MTEQTRLDTVLKQYRDLMPGVEVTVTKSNIIVRCCDYKEALEEKADWLAAAEERLKEEVPWDDLETVRVLLDEQQVSVKLHASTSKLMYNWRIAV